MLACLCFAGFARQGPALATFSIFVEPLGREFGWSRTALSGAVSLAGLAAALFSPLIGPWLDRRGARFVLCLAVLVNAAALGALSLVSSLVLFYLFYCFARTVWAVPFDIAIYGGIARWFVARRAFATSLATVAQMAGLVAMPLVAQLAIDHEGWRGGWVALAAVTLTFGFVPAWLFLASRPEDLGLAPQRAASTASDAAVPAERNFSRQEALRTPAFWLLITYTALVFQVQAGVSLHQAPHLIERGIDATTAATIVSTFSFTSGLAALASGFLPRRLPIRVPLALVGVLLVASTLLLSEVSSAASGYAAAALFGFGLGGILALLPVAWADYFGHMNFGAIRGLALSAQVLAQAAGPLLSGALRDLTGDYTMSLYCFAALSALSVAAAAAARRPTGAAARS